MITSRQNPKLKLVRALSSRPKERRETGAFLAEGVRLIEEALAADWPIRFVLYAEGLGQRGTQLLEALNAKGVDLEQISSDLMQSLSDTETSQGILAVLNDSRLSIPAALDFVLILDSIREPGNLGTLVRTAAAAGVQAVILPPETTEVFAPKVVRAGMGAHFRLPIHSMSWDEIEKMSKTANLQTYLADMNGQSCWECDLRQPLAMIVGGEAQGASAAARKLAHQQISIPMPGQAESLNAAVAGSVLMFEVVRQRSYV
jgi:TrmH family RNA methyltransferase